MNLILCHSFEFTIKFFLLDYGKMYRSDTVSSGFSLDTPVNDLTLREKVEQVALHAEWLKNNQKVLTDLYEHFSMVGSDDPELPGDYQKSSVIINDREVPFSLNV